MQMKRDRIERHHESELFTAILTLKTQDEARNFFYDLCTPAELEGLVDRWRVAQLLLQKIIF